VEPAVGDEHLQPQAAGIAAGRLQLHLVDREAQVVEAPDPARDPEALVDAEHLLVRQLVPELLVTGGDAGGGLHVLVDLVGGAAQRDRQVEQVTGDVVDQDAEVEVPLAVGETRMDLAGLGVDQDRLEGLAVALEEGVGQRAVAPEHAGAVQVHQQDRHRVQQPLAVLGQARQPLEQPPVLPGMGQELGDQDGVAAGRLLDQPDRRHRRQRPRLEVAQHLVLLAGDPGRQLLERVQDAVGEHEADRVAARTDGQLPEVRDVRRPALQRLEPWQREQTGRRPAQADREVSH
jgi:hypothetical protein